MLKIIFKKKWWLYYKQNHFKEKITYKSLKIKPYSSNFIISTHNLKKQNVHWKFWIYFLNSPICLFPPFQTLKSPTCFSNKNPFNWLFFIIIINNKRSIAVNWTFDEKNQKSQKLIIKFLFEIEEKCVVFYGISGTRN